MLAGPQLKKAVRLNRKYGQSLGWAKDRDGVAAELGFPNQSLSEQAFAEGVATYQKGHPPLVSDGILGPNTWSKLAATVAFSPAPEAGPAAKPKKKRRVVYHEGDVTAADLQVNDAYDLTLVERPDSDFELVMFMKLQFFFEDSKDKKWNTLAKNKYIHAFTSRVQTAFNHRVLGELPTGEKVRLKVKFQTQIEGFMFDHWELTVRFSAPSDRSYVATRDGNVVLSDRDIHEVTRFSCNPSDSLCGPIKQITAVHEFAHMIGLDDEYGEKFGGAVRPGNDDEQSLLNIGGELRPRHKAFLMDWVKDALLRGK